MKNSTCHLIIFGSMFVSVICCLISAGFYFSGPEYIVHQTYNVSDRNEINEQPVSTCSQNMTAGTKYFSIFGQSPNNMKGK